MEPIQTASAAYTTASTLGQAASGISPTWLGRIVTTVTGVTSKITSSNHAFYVICSGLAIGSLFGNAYEYWAVNRKVQLLTSQLTAPKVNNKQQLLRQSDELIKDLNSRVKQHEANSSRNFLTLNAIATIVLPPTVLFLTGSNLGLVPLGTAAVSLLCRGIATLTYNFREEGLAGVEQGYIKQLQAAKRKSPVVSQLKYWFLKTD